MKVGDEIECIRDCPWKGIVDYMRVGDRGRLIRRDMKGNQEIFDMEIIKGWHAGQTAPVSASGFSRHFKIVEEPKVKYRVGTRLVAREEFTLSYMHVKRGDVAVITAQVDSLFEVKHEVIGKKMSFYDTDLDRYFDIEVVNNCPPCLRKWLADIQTRTR